MEFRTERLLLRPWRESDAESLYEYARDPEVGPIAGWPVHTSVENSREIIRDVRSAEETYAVCLQGEGRAIGSIGLIPPMQSHTRAADDEMEIGYWIGVPFWGQGLIPEAVRRLQQHAFEDLGCSALWCGYYDGNVKSKRCQEKCGFTFHHTEENKPCALMGDVRTEHFTILTREEWEKMNRTEKKSVVLYVHGKGGSASESEHYVNLFPKCDVVGFDYQASSPWEAVEEFRDKIASLRGRYDQVILIANSIGAFFSMSAGIGGDIRNAYFISPIVNMEKLITDMMMWAGVTEQDLAERQIIPTDFGEDMSWEYLEYVRNHPLRWEAPTTILYGSKDHLQSLETVTAFAQAHHADLTVMDGGEHWFHTQEQMEFLDNWIRRSHIKEKI